MEFLGQYVGRWFRLWLDFYASFLGLVLWGIFALVRGGMGHGCSGHGNHKEHGEKTALDILKERYAKGEINKEEFEAKKKDLQ